MGKVKSLWSSGNTDKMLSEMAKEEKVSQSKFFNKIVKEKYDKFLKEKKK